MGKFKEMAISEELPYWEFVGDPQPHVILTDGSLTAGLKIDLVDVECFDTLSTNHMTAQIRSLLNSLNDGSKVQLVLSIDSDFSELLNKHEKQLTEDAPETVKELSAKRVSQIREEIKTRILYRPTLYAFINLKQTENSPLSFFKKEEEFLKQSDEKYKSTLEELNQQLNSLKSSFDILGLETKNLELSDLIEITYRFLNPTRSTSVPHPDIFSPTGIQVESEALKGNP